MHWYNVIGTTYVNINSDSLYMMYSKSSYRFLNFFKTTGFSSACWPAIRPSCIWLQIFLTTEVLSLVSWPVVLLLLLSTLPVRHWRVLFWNRFTHCAMLHAWKQGLIFTVARMMFLVSLLFVAEIDPYSLFECNLIRYIFFHAKIVELNYVSLWSSPNCHHLDAESRRHHMQWIWLN